MVQYDRLVNENVSVSIEEDGEPLENEESVKRSTSPNTSLIDTVKEVATPSRMLSLAVKWAVFILLIIGVILFGFRKHLLGQTTKEDIEYQTFV